MPLTLKIDRDITRFIDDDTFPFKVTVCIGEKRIICSGIALAEQSHALEMKIREDNGILLFEEWIEVPEIDEILQQCIRYLHGAPLHLNFNNIEVIMKFSSWYNISALFTSCFNWLESELLFSESVEVTINGVMKLFKISNCLCDQDSTVLKDLAHKLILAHRSETFWNEIINRIHDTISGFDVVRMIEKSPKKHKSSILVKWITLSIDNKEFVLKNYSFFDFPALFPNEDNFSSFISLMSDESTLSSKQVKTLLDIQKDYFKKSSVLFEQSSTSQLSKDQTKLNDFKLTDCKEAAQGSYCSPCDTNDEPQLGPAKTKSDRTPWYCDHYEEDDLLDFPFRSDNSYLEVHNLPLNTSESDLWHIFNNCHGLEDIDIIEPDKDHAILTLSDELAAKNLAKSFWMLKGNKLQLRPCSLNGDYGNNATTSSPISIKDESEKLVLYIGNIPLSFKEREIRQLFSGFGRIQEFVFPTIRSGRILEFCYGFLTYENIRSARGLLKASCNKDYVYRGNKLIIKERD